MKKTLFFVSIVIVLSACKPSGNHNDLPGYSGSPGEVVVVVKDELWNSSAGDSIRVVLEKDQHGLPQSQPVFNLIHVSPKKFGNLFQLHRNIILISSGGKKTGVIVRKDKWARGQIIIDIQAEQEEKLLETFQQNAHSIVRYINDRENARLISANRKFGDKGLSGKIEKNHQLSMVIPKGYEIAHETENFIWLRGEKERALGGYKHQIGQGILIYHYPYRDSSAFSAETLLEKRDSITKRYIPGPSENSYMGTNYQYILPESEAINFKEQYAVEIRGLWKVINDFMGGPFVSLSTLDEKRNRVVTVEGYVYAPQFNKREYLREVEAIIKSLDFPE